MKFSTKVKLHNFKKQFWGKMKDTYYFLVTPLAWCEDKLYSFKHKKEDREIENLSHEQVANLLIKHINQILVEDSNEVFEFYICESKYYAYGEYSPRTVFDYIEEMFYFTKKRKYKIMRSWVMRKSSYSNKENEYAEIKKLTEAIYSQANKYDDLDVHWEYETDLTDPRKTWDVIKNYEKHLVIKLKK